MPVETFPIEPNVRLVLSVNLHVTVSAHDHPDHDVRVENKGPGSVHYEQLPDGEGMLLQFQRGSIAISRETPLHIRKIGGHVTLRDLPQGSTGTDIEGHLSASHCGLLQFEHVGAHVTIQRISGAAQLGRVGGHLKASDIGGQVSAESVGGHVNLLNVEGSCHLPQVGGHARLEGVKGQQIVDAGGMVRTRINPEPNMTYELSAGGPMRCSLPAAPDATVHLDGPLASGSSPGVRTYGNGSAQIRLQAGGPISVPVDGDGDGILSAGSSLREAMREAKKSASNKVRDVLKENNITPETAADLNEQFSEIVDEALEVAKEVAVDVRDKAREVLSPGRAAQAETSASSEESASEAAMAEERKMILRMLAEEKITVEEASSLLQALKG